LHCFRATYFRNWCLINFSYRTAHPFLLSPNTMLGDKKSSRWAQTYVACIIFQYNKNGVYLTLGLPNNFYNPAPSLQMRHFSCLRKTRCSPCQQQSISYTICQFSISVCTSRWSINLWPADFASAVETDKVARWQFP
jgi:hypothetical protein